MDFAKGLMPTLKSWQPDITLNGYANALVLEQDVKEKALGIPGVKSAFGTAYLDNVPAVSSRQGIDHINLESYDEFLFESVKDEVVEGNLYFFFSKNSITPDLSRASSKGRFSA